MTQKKNAPAVTPIDQMQNSLGTELVELPGWTPDTTVTFRLRRCSLRGLVTSGKVPNPLLAAAQRLYEGQSSKANANFAEIIKVMNLVVDNALVEPKLSELSEAGIELTEDQFGMIWSYAQKGALALTAFRAIAGNPAGDQDSGKVENAAK